MMSSHVAVLPLCLLSGPPRLDFGLLKLKIATRDSLSVLHATHSADLSET